MHFSTAAAGGLLQCSGAFWPLADEIVFKAQFPALKCLETFLQVTEFMAMPFTDQNLIWWLLAQLNDRGSRHQHWSAYSVPDWPQWHSNHSIGVAQWFFTCDKRITSKLFSNGPQSAKDDTGKAGWWSLRWESWRASGFKNKAVCTPAQKCPAKLNTLVCCIMPEPSGWVKSVTANKVANFPRLQLSQALFCVIFH